jgi:hypothetical protein
LKVDGNGQLGWATDSTTDSTKLPLAGGTLTGTLNIGNGSITTGSNFSLNGNALTVTGSSGTVIEGKRAGSATIQATNTTDSTDLQLRADSTGGLVRTASNHPLVFGTSQTERMRIENNGTLVLKNNSNMMIDLQSSAGTGSAWIEFSDTDGTRKGYFGYGSSGSEKVYWVQSKAANMSMYSNGNDRFEIQSDGKKIVKNGNLNINSTYIDFSGNISTPQTGVAIFRPASDTLACSINNSERLRISSNGQLLQGSSSTDQGWAVFYRAGSSGGDAGTAGQDAAGDKGVNIRSDMGPSHTDLTGVDNYTLKLTNGAYAGTGIANPQGTIAKILFNTTTYNGWNAYAAIACDTQGVSGGRGDLAFLTASGTSIMSERLRIDSSGRLLLGPGAIAVPKGSAAGSFDLDNGNITMCIGGNENSTGRTNSTNKLNRITSPHYTNAEEPVALISSYNVSNQNIISYGGGSGQTNTVTKHSFYTSANTTTTNGSERFRIDERGEFKLKSNDNNWVTVHYNHNSRGFRRHYREFNAGTSAAQYSLIRIRRHWWGWGHYKITIKRLYYSSVVDAVFYITGHGRTDGSYNANYAVTDLTYDSSTSNVHYSGRITISTPSTSSPGDASAAYIDVLLQCPAYMYFAVEVEASTSAYSTSVSNINADGYALHT